MTKQPAIDDVSTGAPPFLFLQEASRHVFVAHLPEGSWQGRESPPCYVRH